MRVVVADDEPKVCQLICNLVDWEALGMEIVGTASNGQEALELIHTLHPDLIITDIRMPGCTGLELIEQARRLQPQIEFIIVSGYRHFEYAQSAIRFGVSDYLAKPIKKNELMDTLEKMRDKHMQNRDQITKEERLKIRMQNDSQRLRANLFRDLLQNPSCLESATLSFINTDYHYRILPGCFQMAMVKTDFFFGDADHPALQLFWEKAVKILRGNLSPCCYDMEIYHRENVVYILLNFAADQKATLRKQIKYCLDELLIQKGMLKGLEITLGLGTVVEEIGAIGVSLQSARCAIAQRLLDGTDKLIENPSAILPQSQKGLWMAEFSKNMDAALEVLDINGAVAAVERVRQQFLANKQITGMEVFDLACEAYSVFLLLLRKHQPEQSTDIQWAKRFALRADCCGNIDKLFAFLSQCIEQSISTIAEERKQADTRPIRIAKQYIQANFSAPITLEEVSNVVGFNASYFSALFKKESGMNFVDYLLEMRMNKAKELLRETNLSVAAVCREVGYSDLKHFTKSFKKYTGISPNEFRKIYA